jgi:mRNA-degrading endonuclease RelE of RelBE toxin-antitoxin system
MKVIFLKEFSKDLDSISLKSIKLSLKRVIERMEDADALSKIPNTKKLQGHKTAYRTRIGDYRLGFFFEDEIILFARFVHRKDIYKLFP